MHVFFFVGEPPAFLMQPHGDICLFRVVACLRKPCNTKGSCWDIRMLPKRKANMAATNVLHECGQTWKAITDANHGIPPLCCAFDNALAHMPLNQVFLGLMRPHDRKLKEMPFLSKCRSITPEHHIPNYIFRTMAFGGHPVFAHNDSPHTQKCLSRALRTRKRSIMCCGYRCHFGIMLMQGLPVVAYRGHDNQSDKEAAHLLNPAAIPPVWDRYGVVLWQFFAALTTGQWLSSKQFEPLELLENALTGYYVTLMDVWKAWKLAGHQWETLTYSKLTVRNILFTCGHLVERLLHFPDGVPFEPCCCMEVSCLVLLCLVCFSMFQLPQIKKKDD